MFIVGIINYIPKLNPLILTSGIILGSYYYMNLNNIYKSIYYYLILMLCIDVSSRYLGASGNNLIILLVYSLLEVIAVSLFYFKYLLNKRYIILYVIATAGIGYIMWELYYYIINKVSIREFQPYSKIIDNFIIIVMAMTYMYEKVNNYKESKWNNFQLNIAVLIFFTLNTLIFLPVNFLVNEDSGVKYYFWTGNVLLLLLFYSFLIFKIWKNGKIRKQ